MITAHRTHRHFNLPRTFDVDKYLDQQLEQQAEEQRLAEIEHFGRAPRYYMPPGETDPRRGHFMCMPLRLSEPTDDEIRRAVRNLDRSRFRGWAIRLNDRIERWMDSVDWKQIDTIFSTVGGFALTGFVAYMGYIMLDAWLQGRFNLGAN